MKMQSIRQSGLSLFGFVFVIVILALVAILGMKVTPTVVEFSAIKKAITNAKDAGGPREIQAAFDKHASAGYIESIAGKDLNITRTADGYDVGVAYEKKINLFGPVSLVIDYVAGAGNSSVKKPE
jgi:hypothetical protein